MEDSSNIVAFTDGSALGNPGPTGAGAVIYGNGMSSIPTKLASGVSKLSNNVHGEIFAIKLACSNIATIIRKDQHKSINIFSDCQAAILVISNMEKSDNYSELIRDIQISLFELQYRYNLDIHIYWVPGHAEIQQNEMADHLAKVGARHVSISTATHSTTMSEACKAIKDITLCKWNKRWSHKRNNSAYKTKVIKDVNKYWQEYRRCKEGGAISMEENN